MHNELVDLHGLSKGGRRPKIHVAGGLGDPLTIVKSLRTLMLPVKYFPKVSKACLDFILHTYINVSFNHVSVHDAGVNHVVGPTQVEDEGVNGKTLSHVLKIHISQARIVTLFWR